MSAEKLRYAGALYFRAPHHWRVLVQGRLIYAGVGKDERRVFAGDRVSVRGREFVILAEGQRYRRLREGFERFVYLEDPDAEHVEPTPVKSAYYTRLDGGAWGIKVFFDAAEVKVGQLVAVRKRDGSTMIEQVGSIVERGDRYIVAAISGWEQWS